jgi:TP901 family phage tail tape measure protein
MAKQLAIGLVIGGAVSRSVGAAFKDVEGRVKRLESTASKARVLQSVIGETRKLQDEWRRAHQTGASSAETLRRRLDTNLEALRKQGVEVRNLGRAYEQMGRKARSAELKSVGQTQMRQGAVGLRNTAAVATGAAAATMIVPTRVSAEYGAVIRDIAIKAGVAGTDEEKRLSSTVIDTSRSTGMARNDVADVVNALAGAGMDLKQALKYAPVAAKFVVGQGADANETATMINSLMENAKITNPEDMLKALEAIAFQGQAGSFEASDMAKWFPELLSQMAQMGITGNKAVNELGSMLQVQMKTAGSADAAANNLKNWISKIGSQDVVKAYKDAGIDYSASIATGFNKGLSTIEASFELAQRYVAATDPKKAAAMAEAMKKIDKEADPTRAQEMATALEASLRTGNLFADMQVKAALTGYMQSKKLYGELKSGAASASGILDKNLAERRETSANKWKETGQAMDDALRSAGDAMQPGTDRLASMLTRVSRSVSDLSDRAPALVTGLLGAGAAIATVAAAYSAIKIAKGAMNLGRGTLMGNPNIVHKVAVVNGLGGGLGTGDHDLTRRGRKGRRGRVSPSSASTAAGSAKPRVRVYPGGATETPRSLSSWKPPTSTPVPAKALMPAVKSSGSVLSGLKGVGRGNVATALFEAAFNTKDVYDNAQTRDEKAEGYGGAAGTLAGTLAGAAAGAAIGSVVPVIGTAIGGLIGGYLGSMSGGALGGVVGKSLFGSTAESVASRDNPSTPLLMRPRPGPAVPSLASMGASFESGVPLVTRTASSSMPGMNDVARSLREADARASTSALTAAVKPSPPKQEAPKIDQKITLSPTFTITVQGDAKDPQALLNQMMPEIERRLTETAQQAARRNMTDEPII